MSSFIEITVGARASALSKAQFQEVQQALPHVKLIPKFVDTTGDRDLQTSLRTLGKSNFFTKEIDEMQLRGECRITIHSAKDLPDPLPEGLTLAALTKGVDASDSLVLREGESLANLPFGARIGTSCERRENTIKALREDLVCVDIRGTIERRLELLDQKQIDGVVIAEAALIRLDLTARNRLPFNGETAPLQGKLAILARSDDQEMHALFSRLDTRKKILYLGLEPGQKETLHYPVIKIAPRVVDPSLFEKPYTHIIFTSKTTVALYPGNLENKYLLAIGEATALSLEKKGFPAHITAKEETQEGIICLLQAMNLKDAFFFLPRSSRSRSVLVDFFQKNQIAYEVCDLYDTVLQKPEPIPDLTEIEEIVFTSPSTVEGFLKIYGSIPVGKKITAIGPVTTNVLKDMMDLKT